MGPAGRPELQKNKGGECIRKSLGKVQMSQRGPGTGWMELAVGTPPPCFPLVAASRYLLEAGSSRPLAFPRNFSLFNYYSRSVVAEDLPCAQQGSGSWDPPTGRSNWCLYRSLGKLEKSPCNAVRRAL